MKTMLKLMICTLLFGLLGLQNVQAKKHKVHKATVYMVGVAVSVADSASYMTDLQRVEGVTIQHKTKFLMDRQLYSLQFQRHLEANSRRGGYVPSVIFGTKLKKMENRYLKLHKRYAGSRLYALNVVDQSQFRFHAEEYIEQEHTEDVVPKEKKAKKKSKKS